MRKRTGSLLPFFASSSAGFILFASLFVNAFIYFLAQERANMACEAAALAAATDISRIVVRDDHFGYVALTDWPAGSATLNAAGEPMPIVGINTLIATCRESLLIARKLHSATMTELALADLAACKKTAALLNHACEEALAASSSKRPIDRDGAVVDAYAEAKQAFDAAAPYLNEYNKLAGLKVELGSLDGFASSGIALPAAAELAEVESGACNSGNYDGFVNIPVCGSDFYFAGLAEQTSLCSKKKFRPLSVLARPCSAVLVSATISNSTLKNSASNEPATNQSKPGMQVFASAAALPGKNPDLTNPPMFVLSFPNGMAEEDFSLAKILQEGAIHSPMVETQRVQGGDYPDELSASLVRDSALGDMSLSDLGAKGLFDWLRACRGKVRMESLLVRVNEPLLDCDKEDPRKIFVLTVDPTGNVRTAAAKEFTSETILDGQNFAISYDAEIGDSKWTVSLRDQVSNLSLSEAKHAGRCLVDNQCVGLVETVYPKDGLAVALQFAAPH